MVRKILALVAGVITFWVVVTLVQLVTGLLFGMPDAETMGSPEKMKVFVMGMSVGGFIGLLLGYIIGSFASGFVMRKLSQWDSLVLPLIVGLLGTAGWAYTIVQIPHPMWVTILGFLCYIPFAILGYRSAK